MEQFLLGGKVGGGLGRQCGWGQGGVKNMMMALEIHIWLYLNRDMGFKGWSGVLGLEIYMWKILTKIQVSGMGESIGVRVRGNNLGSGLWGQKFGNILTMRLVLKVGVGVWALGPGQGSTWDLDFRDANMMITYKGMGFTG